MDDFIEVIKSIQMVQGTASTLVLQGAILDLAARLDKLTERVGELELASPCPMLKSICEDWEYTGKLDGTERIKIPISQPKFGPLLNDAKPAPDEEMVEPPEFHDFCERIFIPGTDYRTGDIRMLLREHMEELYRLFKKSKPGTEDALPLPHHDYIVEVPVHVDGMMQVWAIMPEGCDTPRVFIGHASQFKGWRETK